jgi:hypothetical protein
MVTCTGRERGASEARRFLDSTGGSAAEEVGDTDKVRVPAAAESSSPTRALSG